VVDDFRTDEFFLSEQAYGIIFEAFVRMDSLDEDNLVIQA
jgi:hypothetical protein